MLPLKYKIPFQHLQITDRCDLLCDGCLCWTKNTTEQTVDQLLNQTNNLWGINICGGNPLLYSELPELLNKLKKKKLFVSLTTNGLLLDQIAPQLLLLIDLLVIYVPGITKEEIKEKSGINCLKHYQRIWEYLKEQKKKFLLHCPIHNFNLTELPEFYEQFRNNPQAYLWLSWRKTEHKINSQERAYFKYYAQRPKVIATIYTEKYNPDLCAGCFQNQFSLKYSNLKFFWELFYKLYF